MTSLTGRPLREPTLVQGMTARLVHRGPDESGYYVNATATAALGHRRLRIIDLEGGQQPMGLPDGSVWVSFNGEIYGFQELRHTLAADGCQFQSRSDTEVILHLYARYGLDCLARLPGMFAFALWDERRQSLLLARDRLGKKPLYYAVTADSLLFASELTALAIAPVSRELDLEALDQFLTLGYIPAPRTIYQHVKKLEAGQALTLSGGRVALRHYWRPDPVPGHPARVGQGVPDLCDELRERLRSATAVRMVSDVPLGCFLSGGVDSSTVLSFMAELSPRPVKTFSIGFPDADYSELEHARRIARHFGTEHHEFVLEPDGVHILDRLVQHFGEPFADSSALPTWYLSQLTRKEVTVALSGDGGDELFGGYNWYRTAARLDRLATLARPVDWLVGQLSKLPSTRRRTLLARLGKACRLLRASPGQRHAALRVALSDPVKACLYGQELLARRQEALRWLAGRHDALQVEDPLNRMMMTDLMTYLPEDLLVKVDRMTMAHALECRSPLLDAELVQWVLALPAAVKLDPGQRGGGQRGKWLLREAMRDRFPPGFLDRPKQGFSVPLERWFQGDLRTLVRDRVLHGPLHRLGLFRPEGVHAIVHEHFEGRVNHAPVVWALLVLATWVGQGGHG